MEDLWAFNEEVLARAIAAARTPIVSGVGHETDVTIADMVADHRAATPTAAAMVAVPDRSELTELVGSYRQRITRGMSVCMKHRRDRVSQVSSSAVFRDPGRLLHNATQRADELHHRLAGSLLARLARARNHLAQPADRLARQHPATQLERARGRMASVLQRLRWALGARAKRAGDTMLSLQGRLATADPQHRVAMARQHVEAIGRQLDAMSYRNVLARGYTVSRSPDGQLLTSAAQAKTQPTLLTEFSDGTVETHSAAPPVRKPRRTKKQSTPSNPPTLFDQDPS
jgi:exodeoxyribonuclease VII large subunit